MSKFLIYCAVYVFLRKDGKVYLMRRANTGYRDGLYSVPAGHVEEGETLLGAIQRELKEETGLNVPQNAFKLAHAMYRRGDDRTYADYYFTCDAWEGTPRIMEQDKCDKELWFPETHLPEDMISEVRYAYACILEGKPFSDVQIHEKNPKALSTDKGDA